MHISRKSTYQLENADQSENTYQTEKYISTGNIHIGRKRCLFYLEKMPFPLGLGSALFWKSSALSETEFALI